MVRFYDNWERLVEVVMHREQLRQLSLCDSLSSSSSTPSRDSSFDISSNTLYDVGSFRPTPSPLHPDAMKLALADSINQGEQNRSRNMPAKRRNPIWNRLSIFRGFSLKKDYGREQRDLTWAAAHRTTLHGLHPIEATNDLSTKQMYEEVFETDMSKRRADTERLQELFTLKGHLESVLRAKGIDLGSIPLHYTI